ncbi:hypothetical protein Rhe02_52060 [Rhizocola hellebori]|uniref:Uncharacterized protein n=1 Tax=Rhizocola hellebori TaxID=1392758 RepID=A0A8J3QAF9_9ACTN|nr:hypothetical protein [Rhizocola hellebori]GIH07139.1 hypothetical protein Rhe02_52060 [Rhizocola hellebori]
MAQPAPSPTRSAAAPPSISPIGGLSGCPVTQPVPAGPEVPAGALFGQTSAFGNADLWVGALGPAGVFTLEPDPVHGMGTKLGWYRITAGELQIAGRRLDGPAPALISHVPDGYGETGFQSSGVDFPSEGCWERALALGRLTTSGCWIFCRNRRRCRAQRRTYMRDHRIGLVNP